MLGRAHLRLGDRADLRHGDAAHLPFPDASVDLVTAYERILRMEIY